MLPTGSPTGLETAKEISELEDRSNKIIQRETLREKSRKITASNCYEEI